MLYCEKCDKWVEHYPMFGRKQRCLICNSKLRKEPKIDISKLDVVYNPKANKYQERILK